ncbi:MAG: hypothetical protein CL534_19460 [Ahrensia sp.]|nr:hypothetical protein [Ahrensia sp.]
MDFFIWTRFAAFMFNKFFLVSLLTLALPMWAFSAEMPNWNADETRVISRDADGNPVEVEMLFPVGVYVGHVTDGVPNGPGTFTWSETGRSFEGNWVHGLQDGNGIYVSSKGTRIPIYYEMGELVADPAVLTTDYRERVCLFAHAVAQGGTMAEPESIEVEEESDGVIIIVEPSSDKPGIPTRCQFRSVGNGEPDELIELHWFGSEPIAGSAARDLGKGLLDEIFIPELEP